MTNSSDSAALLRLKPSSLELQVNETQEVVVSVRDTPVVWKAFTNDAAHFKMRPGAGVIKARGKASVHASVNDSDANVAAQIVAKPLTEAQYREFMEKGEPDKTAAAKTLFSTVSQQGSKHVLSISHAGALKSQALHSFTTPSLVGFVLVVVLASFAAGVFLAPALFTLLDEKTV